MGFRISCDDSGTGGVVLRIEGRLTGEEAAGVLRDQIAQAAAGGRPVVVDLRDVDWYGDACLAILQEPSQGVSLAGGGTLLAVFLEQRRTALRGP
jgi:anti-anti-sigma regulatory factor